MNLIKTGHDVSVWNRTASKTVQFRNEGATVYDTKRQIVENCDIIFGKKPFSSFHC
jgi:3-hydroxyisobutyrate dehydrogenase-like beta-hydroxyacid dehydrogenase